LGFDEHIGLGYDPNLIWRYGLMNILTALTQIPHNVICMAFWVQDGLTDFGHVIMTRLDWVDL
jgi:hypothetical protein